MVLTENSSGDETTSKTSNALTLKKYIHYSSNASLSGVSRWKRDVTAFPVVKMDASALAACQLFEIIIRWNMVSICKGSYSGD